jgi:phage-related protein
VKPTHFVGSSRKDLQSFPPDVRKEVGFALFAAERGDSVVHSVPLVGFGGASLLEVIVPFDRSTFRAVYTIKFRQANYVLHAFQKKSKTGIKTPQRDMELIRSRLKDAERHYRENYESHTKKGTKSNDKGAKGRS